jgi:hypothetical protein
MSRALSALLACALLLTAAATARERALWATINVCDTFKHPDRIGIRGSMPGDGNAAEQMFMRIRVQYFEGATSRWQNIEQGGDSGWIAVGSARYKARQGGATFTFAPPAGGSWQLRGAVAFEWRLDGKVQRHVRLLTTAGHHADGADPAGYSSDTCVIS